jgi:hypothetical protein
MLVTALFVGSTFSSIAGTEAVPRVNRSTVIFTTAMPAGFNALARDRGASPSPLDSEGAARRQTH